MLLSQVFFYYSNFFAYIYKKYSHFSYQNWFGLLNDTAVKIIQEVQKSKSQNIQNNVAHYTQTEESV